jgi:acyl-CoA thioesterase
MRSPEETARLIVDKMYFNDPFSQWLGIERLEDAPGQSRLRMTVRPEMLQGHGTAHGGITYSLADSALAFASNAHGKVAVSIETSISHIQPVFGEDVLTTDVLEVSLTNRLGIYHITVLNQHDVEVAHFKGTVYRKNEDWEV